MKKNILLFCLLIASVLSFSQTRYEFLSNKKEVCEPFNKGCETEIVDTKIIIDENLQIIKLYLQGGKEPLIIKFYDQIYNEKEHSMSYMVNNNAFLAVTVYFQREKAMIVVFPQDDKKKTVTYWNISLLNKEDFK